MTDMPETTINTEVAAERQRRRRSFLTLAIALIVGSILALVLFVYSFMKLGFFSEGEQKITSTGIGGTFSEIAELSVEEYNFTNVGQFDEEGLKFFGIGVPFTGKSFLITYDGVVKAGIPDLSRIDIDIDDAAQTITLTSPKVEVTNAEIDPNSITVYDQSMNPFNQFEVEDLSSFLAIERDNAQQKAIDRGLLERAEARSETLLEAHVTALLEGSDKEGYSVLVAWE